ncbi:MAG: efflux RND transporter periplasmic adaptor subunit [Desulfomonilaceae bacterium]|nr:efflux RND transporter periplasmic adaptor subunit [Desulfomonilaceae bacterium]
MSALLFVVLALGGCGTQEQPRASREPMRPKVPVAAPLEKEIVDWDEYTGRFAAIESVEVRARVSGYLQSIHFEDGAFVDKGDLLFVIDPRPFKAELEQATGELQRAEARAELTKLQLARQAVLLDEKAISRDQYDTRLSEHRQALAQVHAARAAVTAAELNLEFTEVRSPIKGRISRHLVTVGNLINGGTADSTLLTTIVSLDPIFFYFDVDERTYLKYAGLGDRGKLPAHGNGMTPAFAKLSNERDFAHRGHIDFVDTGIGRETGSIRFRAVYPNTDGILVPGMFARVRVPASRDYNALLIPESAVGRDQAIQFVYVANEEGVVERRNIEMGPQACGLRVVGNGLKPRDRVIVKGTQFIRAGAVVEPVEERIELAARNCLAEEYMQAVARLSGDAAMSSNAGMQ